MKFLAFLELVRSSLEEYFNEVDRWFFKSEKLRSYKPQNGGWSIDEILEHISLTNHFLLILINKGKEKALKTKLNINPNDLYYQESEIRNFESIGKHASFEWIRPEHMEPKGIEPLDVFRTTIKEQVHNCLEVLGILQDGSGLGVKTTMSVHNLGKIDVYQYVYFLLLHAKRHIEQMKKIELEFVEQTT